MLIRWSLPLAIAALMAAPASAADQSVTATSDNSWSPDDVTIDLGDKVTWTNGGGIHNVQFNDGSFTQPPQPAPPPWSAQRTFNTPGIFRYQCGLHGAAMSGVVRVRDATGQVPVAVPPGLTVSTRAEMRLRRLLKRGVPVETGCENGCDAKLKLTLAPRTAERFGFRERRTTIGKLSTAPPPGEPLVEDVELTDRAKRKLEDADRGFKVRLDVDATNDGKSEAARKTIKITP